MWGAWPSRTSKDVLKSSHTDIPVDKRSLKAILGDDAAPYEWLNTTLTSVMQEHVIYPKFDARPAGFSEKWLTFILRGQLGLSFRRNERLPGDSVAGCDRSSDHPNANHVLDGLDRLHDVITGCGLDINDVEGQFAPALVDHVDDVDLFLRQHRQHVAEHARDVVV